MADTRSTRLLTPRYWPAWAGLGLLWLSARTLPYALALGAGRGLGRLAYVFARERRHIAEVNLRLCFPELSAPALQARLRAHFASLGIGLLMTGFAWWASDRKLKPLVEIEGVERLREALGRGRGVILLSAHFTDLEMTGRLLSLHHPFAVMYRRHENPVIERAFQGNRKRRFSAAIPRDDIRRLLRALRDKLPVWYAPDQSYRGPNSTLAPFFGVPAATNTGTARLARVSRAPVLLFTGRRLPGAQGYRLTISSPLEAFPSGDPQADAARINGLIEAAVRQAPEQYLWVHRRFKKRPGLPDPY